MTDNDSPQDETRRHSEKKRKVSSHRSPEKCRPRERGSVQSFPGSSLICLDCQRQALGRTSRTRETHAVAVKQKRSLSIESNDPESLQKRRRRKVTERLDLFSQLNFDLTQEKFPYFQMYLPNRYSTVFPSLVNFHSPFKTIFGMKSRRKLRQQSKYQSDDVATEMNGNESVRSEKVDEEKKQLEASCQTESGDEAVKSLLKQSEYVSEIVRRCLWLMSKNPADPRLWFNANQSKLLFRDQGKGFDISPQAEPQKLDFSYDQPPYLTEPGPNVYQVMVSEKPDKQGKMASFQNSSPPLKKPRSICLCKERDPSHLHCIEEAKYRRMVDQLADLLSILCEENDGCECDETDTGACAGQGNLRELRVLRSSESVIGRSAGKGSDIGRRENSREPGSRDDRYSGAEGMGRPGGKGSDTGRKESSRDPASRDDRSSGTDGMGRSAGKVSETGKKESSNDSALRIDRNYRMDGWPCDEDRSGGCFLKELFLLYAAERENLKGSPDVVREKSVSNRSPERRSTKKKPVTIVSDADNRKGSKRKSKSAERKSRGSAIRDTSPSGKNETQTMVNFSNPGRSEGQVDLICRAPCSVKKSSRLKSLE